MVSMVSIWSGLRFKKWSSRCQNARGWPGYQIQIDFEQNKKDKLPMKFNHDLEKTRRREVGGWGLRVVNRENPHGKP